MIERTQVETFHPRLIVWALATEGEGFSTHECLLTIESIARLSKPIVVLTGSQLLLRPDLYDIIEYGTVLGLKMIIEARPEELTNDILQRYALFGPKVFRLVANGCIIEDPETRFKKSTSYIALKDAIRRLKKNGYEVHLGVTVKQMSVRELAYYHDFAFRIVAQGLYCHLFPPSPVNHNPEHENEIIDALARMKSFSPKSMYISPQCVKYGPRQVPGEMYDDQEYGISNSREWNHFCLGGKTYAFIDHEGKVHICANSPLVCDELRTNGYDFKKIWESSVIFQRLRNNELTCSGTQLLLKNNKETRSTKVELYEHD